MMVTAQPHTATGFSRLRFLPRCWPFPTFSRKSRISPCQTHAATGFSRLRFLPRCWPFPTFSRKSRISPCQTHTATGFSRLRFLPRCWPFPTFSRKSRISPCFDMKLGMYLDYDIFYPANSVGCCLHYHDKLIWCSCCSNFCTLLFCMKYLFSRLGEILWITRHKPNSSSANFHKTLSLQVDVVWKQDLIFSSKSFTCL